VLQPRDNAQRDQRPPAARGGGEAGYALTELLVVTSLLVIVLGAILTLGETSQRIAPKESERANVIREAQVGLHRMTRELRHAYGGVDSSGGLDVPGPRVEAQVLMASGTQTVTYECDVPHPTDSAYTRCMRYVGTSTDGELVVDRVLNGNSVFEIKNLDAASGDTRPDYVRAVVEVGARGDLQSGYDHRVVLDDGFYMRNLDG
jgi:type II secretory pathway pseudopilin PulG